MRAVNGPGPASYLQATRVNTPSSPTGRSCVALCARFWPPAASGYTRVTGRAASFVWATPPRAAYNLTTFKLSEPCTLQLAVRSLRLLAQDQHRIFS